MSLVITIFGGMLLSAVLYTAGRLSRLSNFWSAMMAGGVPCGLYLVYAAVNQPRLDTVVINMVAYPTVAVMLHLLGGEKAKKQGVHWAPMLIVGLFVFLCVFLGTFAYIAINGLPEEVAQVFLPNAKGKKLHTAFAGVVAHGDEASKIIVEQQKLQTKLETIGWHIEVSGLTELHPGQTGDVVLSVKDADGKGINGLQIELKLSRPGERNRAPVLLNGIGAGEYRGQAGIDNNGVWVAHLHIQGAGQNLELDREI